MNDTNYYSTEIYKPKVFTPRAREFRDRFFSMVDEMRFKYDYDDGVDMDYYIKRLEEMKPDVDYLCII